MKTMNLSVIYGIIAVISLLLAIGYCTLVRKKIFWMVWLHFFVFAANMGYFLLSVSKTLNGALMANRISYFGAVFLPMVMLMTVMDVCRIKYRKWVPGILAGISFIMFCITASPGYLDCYYREVSLVFVGNVAKLDKLYGPLHKLYFVYLFAYFASMIGIIVITILRDKITSWKHAAILTVVVFLNIIIWFVEQLIYWDFEFLSVSYVISEILFLFLYGMLQDYDMLQSRLDDYESAAADKQPDLEQIAVFWPEIATLSSRERDVLNEILKQKKRKEIADELCITENTVKKHVTNIFSKLQISNRNELFEKLEHKCKG